MFRLLEIPLPAKKWQQVASNKNREKIKFCLTVCASLDVIDKIHFNIILPSGHRYATDIYIMFYVQFIISYIRATGTAHRIALITGYV